MTSRDGFGGIRRAGPDAPAARTRAVGDASLLVGAALFRADTAASDGRYSAGHVQPRGIFPDAARARRPSGGLIAGRGRVGMKGGRFPG